MVFNLLVFFLIIILEFFLVCVLLFKIVGLLIEILVCFKFGNILINFVLDFVKVGV